ncbi:hypothetical protein HOF92_02030 [bacterium]|jgi:hypothetical protein|nr:hypothetical protein [bacterium]
MKLYAFLALTILCPGLYAHHFKGLPHYGYFENYPQIPQEEFLAQAGKYEVSLVLYDFQGINLEMAEHPQVVRMYLVIYDLLANQAYKGKLRMEIQDRGATVVHKLQEQAQEESIYAIHRELSDKGDYSLLLTLVDEKNTQIRVPFILNSQKVHWGKWIVLSMTFFLVIAGFGARKKRLSLDRKQEIARVRDPLNSREIA